MAIFDIKLPKSIARALNIPVSDARRQQIRVLKKLLRKARFTQFGQKYLFDEILLSKHPGKKFQQLVPTFNYDKLYNEWWYKTLEGTPDVCPALPSCPRAAARGPGPGSGAPHLA